MKVSAGQEALLLVLATVCSIQQSHSTLHWSHLIWIVMQPQDSTESIFQIDVDLLIPPPRLPRLVTTGVLGELR
jgi:hypothetical protein